MTTKDFTNIILAHKSGFIVGTGEINDICSPPFTVSNLFFDTAELDHVQIVTSSKRVDWLRFTNDRSDSGLSMANIDLNDVTKITEHAANYLSESFDPPVQRVFDVQMQDSYGHKAACTIGLL